MAKSDLGGDRKATASELFSFRSDYPRPLAPRHLVAEVEERLDFKGEVLIPLSDDDVRRLSPTSRGRAWRPSRSTCSSAT